MGQGQHPVIEDDRVLLELNPRPLDSGNHARFRSTVMTNQSAAAPDRPRLSVSTTLWRVAGTIGPVILSHFRNLTFLFAGSFPDIVAALVNSVIVPLLNKAGRRDSSHSR
jgi:hypothetical protein